MQLHEKFFITSTSLISAHSEKQEEKVTELTRGPLFATGGRLSPVASGCGIISGLSCL